MMLVHSKYENVMTYFDNTLIQFKGGRAMLEDRIALSLCAKSPATYFISDRFKYRTAQTVLVIRSGGIGDVLLCTVVPKFIKRVNPNAKITFATFPNHARCLRHNQDIDEVIEIPAESEWPKWEHLINLNGFFENVHVSRENLKNQFEIHRVTMLKNHLLVDEQNEDAKNWSDEISYTVVEYDRQEASKILGDIWNVPFVALATRASEPTRSHPNNLGIAKRFADAGIKVVVLSNNGMDETITGKNILNLTHKTGLDTMGAILEKAALVISPDTGPLHMAGALGKKTVTFFNSFPPFTRVKFYKNCFAFYPKEACASMPCGYAQCPAACFKTITPDMIFNKGMELAGKELKR